MRYFKLIKGYQLPKGLYEDGAVVSEEQLSQNAKGEPIIGDFMRPCTKEGVLITELDGEISKEELEFDDANDELERAKAAYEAAQARVEGLAASVDENVSAKSEEGGEEPEVATVEDVVAAANDINEDAEAGDDRLTPSGLVKKKALEAALEKTVEQAVYMKYLQTAKK